MAIAKETVRRIQLFRDLGEQDLEALAAVAEVVDVEAGQLIGVEGGPAPVLFVVEGLVRAFKANSEGRQQTVARIGPGDAFYLPAAFTRDDSAPTSTEALCRTRLLKLGQADFQRLTTERPSLALVVLCALSEKLRLLVALAHDLGLLSVRGRLASFLVKNAQPDGSLAEHWTHEEIAASIGSVREMVSRTLGAFAREGLISLERRRVELLDRRALEAQAEG